MSVNLLHALAKQYEGEIAVAEANIAIYLKSPVGIGEHPDIVESVHSQITKLADAEEHLGVVRRLVNEELDRQELDIVRNT